MSISLHWIFAWYSYVQEQQEHKQPIQFDGYFNETLRDTMENWQSEFLQLMWQVVGLSLLWYVGSSQSKEVDDSSSVMSLTTIYSQNNKQSLMIENTV